VIDRDPNPTINTSDDERWTVGYGGPDNAWHGAVFPRVRGFLPADRALEIGPGQGLWTRRLRPHCRHLTLFGSDAASIEHCRGAFGSRGMSYVVLGGTSTSGLRDGSIDFVFSWHTLVHSGREAMRAYLRAIGPALRPGAVGLIHHSNFAEAAGPGDSNPHARAPDMSAGVFREECARVGLACTYQELVPWGADRLTDCFSMLTRPANGDKIEVVIEENHGFWHRVRDAARVSGRYTSPFPELQPRVRRTFMGIPLGTRGR